MTDCNEARNLLSEYRRMCATLDECADCPLSREIGLHSEREGCMRFLTGHPSASVHVIQKWSDAHPKSTYLSDFKEKHPKAQLGMAGLPMACPVLLGYTRESCGGVNPDCIKCWNTLIKEKP